MFTIRITPWNGGPTSYPALDYTRRPDGILQASLYDPRAETGVRTVAWRLTGGPGEDTAREIEVINSTGHSLERIAGDLPKPAEAKAAKPKSKKAA